MAAKESPPSGPSQDVGNGRDIALDRRNGSPRRRDDSRIFGLRQNAPQHLHGVVDVFGRLEPDSHGVDAAQPADELQ